MAEEGHSLWGLPHEAVASKAEEFVIFFFLFSPDTSGAGRIN